MKCRCLRHYIWVFAICWSTRLGVFCSKRMKPPMKQENKHSTYFRVLVFVFKLLFQDCSGGQASRSRQNQTLFVLRQINIDMDAIKVSMVRGYHNHTLQTGPSHSTVRKSRRTFTLTRHWSDNKSKAPSVLFLFKTIAKVEWTQSNT